MEADVCHDEACALLWLTAGSAVMPIDNERAVIKTDGFSFIFIFLIMNSLFKPAVAWASNWIYVVTIWVEHTTFDLPVIAGSMLDL